MATKTVAVVAVLVLPGPMQLRPQTVIPVVRVERLPSAVHQLCTQPVVMV
jgi:hypothetical protein